MAEARGSAGGTGGRQADGLELRRLHIRHDKAVALRQIVKRMQEINDADVAETQEPSERLKIGMGDGLGAEVFQETFPRPVEHTGGI